MDVIATMTSKGQVTIPKSVRERLDLDAGDSIHFRVEEGRALIAKLPSFLDMAGTVSLPAGKAKLPWDEVRRRAWEDATRDEP